MTADDDDIDAAKFAQWEKEERTIRARAKQEAQRILGRAWKERIMSFTGKQLKTWPDRTSGTAFAVEAVRADSIAITTGIGTHRLITQREMENAFLSVLVGMWGNSNQYDNPYRGRNFSYINAILHESDLYAELRSAASQFARPAT